MPLRVTVFLPDRPGVEQCLDEGRCYHLGRDADADIAIDDTRVSREHILIDGTNSVWRIRDLGSKNGLRIEGLPVAAAAIEKPVWLSIGGVPVLTEPTASSRRSAVARTLIGARGRDEVVARALDSFRRVASCDRAGFWRSDAPETLTCVRLLGDAEPPPSLSVIAGVIKTHTAVFCSDTTGAAALAARASVVGGRLRALVALPLSIGGGSQGVLYADSTTPGKIFNEYDADLLRGLADQMSIALAGLQVHDELCTQP